MSVDKSVEPTLTRLASNATYPFNLAEAPPEPIQGHLVVEGQNAEFTGDGTPGFGQLFQVQAGAFLDLRNLYVHSIDSGEAFEAESISGLMLIKEKGEDKGTLKGSGLRFEDMHVDLDRGVRGAIFTNFGRLILDGARVTKITVGASLGIALWGAVFFVRGSSATIARTSL